jgi:transglutaminase-like putative cysteine protease
MIYDVSHRTTYRYSIPVSFSHHLLHLTPRAVDRQLCHRTVLSVSPTPSRHVAAKDYSGNPVTFITLQEQHTELLLFARSSIEVYPAPALDPEMTMAWDEVYPHLWDDRSAEGMDAIQYVFDSPFTQVTAPVEDLARDLFSPGRPVLAAALALTQRIHDTFVYDPTATTVSTPVDEVFSARRGVCQDFAHLQIACLRALKVPARYVSGYLQTRPPAGRERLVGADASHAWLAVWCPPLGWVDLDPTNNLVVSDEHITLAWGRDYGDVSPVNGAIFGGGAHTIAVSVEVTPLADDG